MHLRLSGFYPHEKAFSKLVHIPIAAIYCNESPLIRTSGIGDRNPQIRSYGGGLRISIKFFQVRDYIFFSEDQCWFEPFIDQCSGSADNHEIQKSCIIPADTLWSGQHVVLEFLDGCYISVYHHRNYVDIIV